MTQILPAIIIRHKKENLKKCSLKGLESRSDCLFFKYPPTPELPCLNNYILLSLEGEPLSIKDQNKGLILLDGTWRYASKIFSNTKALENIEKRSIPKGFTTAYPRRQDDCINPEEGLASIEALFIAYKVTGRNTKNLLNNYYWKDIFLKQNGFLI